MKTRILQELSTDYQKNLGTCHHEARKSLIQLGRLSVEMVRELDRYGRHVSLSPLLRKFSTEYLNLLFLAGKIDAIRHSTASFDTLLSCGKFSAMDPEKPAEPTPHP